MPNFKPHNYGQSAMVVINFEEQLALDPFALTLHHLIEDHIDLSVFHEKYSNESGGHAAYNPAILLRIIFATDWKRRRVGSALGRYYYSHRMFVVEPGLASIGTNKALSRFS